jgi:hypothetical protein
LGNGACQTSARRQPNRAALRHQITVLERQLGKEKLRFDASDRAFLAARVIAFSGCC